MLRFAAKSCKRAGTLRGEVEIGLGIVVVGTAVVLLAVIVIGPSRRVRDESKMPMETQVRLLLGLDEETGELRAISPDEAVDDGEHVHSPTPFDTAQFTALSDLSGPPPAERSTGAA
jgi:hypothetical protein